MKTIKFREFLAKEILAGEKTSTWRLFDDKDLQTGDRVEFVVWETGEAFGEADIVRVVVKRLGDVTDEDYAGHERFESAQAMLDTYRRYYGDRVTFDTEVKILDFHFSQKTSL